MDKFSYIFITGSVLFAMSIAFLIISAMVSNVITEQSNTEFCKKQGLVNIYNSASKILTCTELNFGQINGTKQYYVERNFFGKIIWNK